MFATRGATGTQRYQIISKITIRAPYDTQYKHKQTNLPMRVFLLRRLSLSSEFRSDSRLCDDEKESGIDRFRWWYGCSVDERCDVIDIPPEFRRSTELRRCEPPSNKFKSSRKLRLINQIENKHNKERISKWISFPSDCVGMTKKRLK